MDVRVGLQRKLSTEALMLLNCGVGEDAWESLGLQRDQNQSILKEISPEYSLEGLMLKLKRQYFGHLMRRADSLEKTDAGKYWGQEEKGTTEGETIGWHHWLDGHELEQALEVGDGQGSLVCCSPWIAKSWTRLSNWIATVSNQKSHFLIPSPLGVRIVTFELSEWYKLSDYSRYLCSWV